MNRAIGWVFVVGLGGCAGESADFIEASDTGPVARDMSTVSSLMSTPSASTTPSLLGLGVSAPGVFTFSPEYIEIDRLQDGTSSDFGDANLFQFGGSDVALGACTPPAGADPFDGTCDARLPATKYPACASPTATGPCACTGLPAVDPSHCVPVQFLDWNELLTAGGAGPDADAIGTHRFLDDVKTDPTSFKSNSCVSTTNVLGKMDLTAGAVTNNTEYAYLALKRYDNNGDAGYTWLFTRLPPRFDPLAQGCSEGTALVYDLTEGDVFISGNFNPSRGAQLTVRRATQAAGGETFLAESLVEPAALTAGGLPVWESAPGTVNLASVNTTTTGYGVFESIAGVDEAANRTDKGAITGEPDGFSVKKNIFAEAAVDIAVFTGGGSLCEQEFFGSVITQPSSSPTSDLKDLLGPRLFNFGALRVEASMAPSCDKAIDFSVDRVIAPGIDTSEPDSESSIACTWTFRHTDGTTKTATSCEGELTLGPADPVGTWQGSVEVALVEGVTCTATQTVASVEVFEPLTASVTTSPTCGLAFDYQATMGGGSAATTTSLSFSGPGTADPASSSSLSGQVLVDGAGTYSAALNVTDVRGDLTCTATASDTAAVAAPLAVSPTVTPTCGLAFDYSAVATGGLAPPTMQWSFGGPGTPTPADATGGSGTVVVDTPGTWSATVSVQETRDGVECSSTQKVDVLVYEPIEPTILLEETCSLEFGFDASVTGGSGAFDYAWTFSGPGTPSPISAQTKDGNVLVDGVGAYAASLMVTDHRSDIVCDATVSKTTDVFAPILVTANLEPTCGLSFDYSATVTGGSPTATQGWTFTGPADVSPANPSALNGNATVAGAGAYAGTFTVNDTRGGKDCSVSASDTVDALAPLGLVVTAVPACDSTFSYSATPTGGSGSYSYAWTFVGSGNVSASTTDSAGGVATVDVANADYTASVLVTDLRSDTSCTSSDSVSTRPLAPITVRIAPDAADIQCPEVQTEGDALTYTASVGGGTGNYTMTWTGCTPTGPTTCQVDPADSDACLERAVYVVVSDGSEICAEQTSEEETYTKRTVITSTNN